MVRENTSRWSELLRRLNRYCVGVCSSYLAGQCWFRVQLGGTTHPRRRRCVRSSHFCCPCCLKRPKENTVKEDPYNWDTSSMLADIAPLAELQATAATPRDRPTACPTARRLVDARRRSPTGAVANVVLTVGHGDKLFGSCWRRRKYDQRA